MGEITGDSDKVNSMLTESRSLLLLLHNIEQLTIMARKAYHAGSTYSSYSDYVLCRQYLYRLYAAAKYYPLSWWLVFRLHL